MQITLNKFLSIISVIILCGFGPQKNYNELNLFEFKSTKENVIFETDKSGNILNSKKLINFNLKPVINLEMECTKNLPLNKSRISNLGYKKFKERFNERTDEEPKEDTQFKGYESLKVMPYELIKVITSPDGKTKTIKRTVVPFVRFQKFDFKSKKIVNFTPYE